jgi:hypothetical protein
VGLRAGLGTEARGKVLCLCRRSNLGRPVCSQTLYCVSYPASGERVTANVTAGLTLRLRIQKVPGLNLGKDTGRSGPGLTQILFVN